MTKSFVSTVLMSTALGVGFFVSTSAGAAGFGGMVTSMLGQPGAENMNVDETLVRMSEKMNRTMPQMSTRRRGSTRSVPSQVSAFLITTRCLTFRGRTLIRRISTKRSGQRCRKKCAEMKI